jgi:hypothetical protein
MEFLTEDGKKMARYYYLASTRLAKIPLLGKYLVAFITAVVVVYITNQGAKENARKTRMPRV